MDLAVVTQAYTGVTSQVLYTVPANKKAMIYRLGGVNFAGSVNTYTLSARIGGTLYPIASDFTAASNSAILGPILPNIVLQQGETFEFVSTQGATNVIIAVLEFDDDSPIRSERTFPTSSGTFSVFTAANKARVVNCAGPSDGFAPDYPICISRFIGSATISGQFGVNIFTAPVSMGPSPKFATLGFTLGTLLSGESLKVIVSGGGYNIMSWVTVIEQ
jgi:hypothetical protein